MSLYNTEEELLTKKYQAAVVRRYIERMTGHMARAPFIVGAVALQLRRLLTA